MQIEGASGKPPTFGQPDFCNAPEVLDPIDGACSVCKFIATMVDPVVFPVTKIH